MCTLTFPHNLATRQKKRMPSSAFVNSRVPCVRFCKDLFNVELINIPNGWRDKEPRETSFSIQSLSSGSFWHEEQFTNKFIRNVWFFASQFCWLTQAVIKATKQPKIRFATKIGKIRQDSFCVCESQPLCSDTTFWSDSPRDDKLTFSMVYFYLSSLSLTESNLLLNWPPLPIVTSDLEEWGTFTHFTNEQRRVPTWVLSGWWTSGCKKLGFWRPKHMCMYSWLKSWEIQSVDQSVTSREVLNWTCFTTRGILEVVRMLPQLPYQHLSASLLLWWKRQHLYSKSLHQDLIAHLSSDRTHLESDSVVTWSLQMALLCLGHLVHVRFGASEDRLDALVTRLCISSLDDKLFNRLGGLRSTWVVESSELSFDFSVFYVRFQEKYRVFFSGLWEISHSKPWKKCSKKSGKGPLTLFSPLSLVGRFVTRIKRKPLFRMYMYHHVNFRQLGHALVHAKSGLRDRIDWNSQPHHLRCQLIMRGPQSQGTAIDSRLTSSHRLQVPSWQLCPNPTFETLKTPQLKHSKGSASVSLLPVQKQWR